jgi:hypothetical protein
MTPLLPVVGALLAGWWLRGQNEADARQGSSTTTGLGANGSGSLPPVPALPLPEGYEGLGGWSDVGVSEDYLTGFGGIGAVRPARVHPAGQAHPRNSGSPRHPGSVEGFGGFGDTAYAPGPGPREALIRRKLHGLHAYFNNASANAAMWQQRAERAYARGDGQKAIYARRRALKAGRAAQVAHARAATLTRALHKGTAFGARGLASAHYSPTAIREIIGRLRRARRKLIRAQHRAEAAEDRLLQAWWDGQIDKAPVLRVRAAQVRIAAELWANAREQRKVLAAYHAAGGKLWRGQTSALEGAPVQRFLPLAESLGAESLGAESLGERGIVYPGEVREWSPDNMALRTPGWGGGTMFDTGFGRRF